MTLQICTVPTAACATECNCTPKPVGIKCMDMRPSCIYRTVVKGDGATRLTVLNEARENAVKLLVNADAKLKQALAEYNINGK